MSVVQPTAIATPTDRVQQAIARTVERYRGDLDGDPGLVAVRVEVRFRPNGSVRTVVLQHESEFENA